jgi:glycosyltransferase involved in cell wall biosynthesis
MNTVDVLMITYNAADYVAVTLPSLLESCDEHTRVWLWHNGDDERTLETTRSFADDPRVAHFHHSRENVGLTDPTNWVWTEGSADFVSKVDDDCLLPATWIDDLRAAHRSHGGLGAIGASRLRPEDIDHALLQRKIEQHGPVSIVRNHWVQGSGYLLPRSVIDRHGVLDRGQSWTNYCMTLARAGVVNGFLYPLIFEDHMDDPRSEHTLLRTDADLEWRMPLSAKRARVTSLDDWERQIKNTALRTQTAPVDLRYYEGWRLRLRNLRNRVDRLRRPT